MSNTLFLDVQALLSIICCKYYYVTAMSTSDSRVIIFTEQVRFNASFLFKFLAATSYLEPSSPALQPSHESVTTYSVSVDKIDSRIMCCSKLGCTRSGQEQKSRYLFNKYRAKYNNNICTYLSTAHYNGPVRSHWQDPRSRSL